MKKIELFPLQTIPEVRPGDDLGEIISLAAQREIGRLEEGDIAVVTMKIVSKAEDRLVRLDQVTPSEKAKRIAGRTGKPARLVQVILDHSEKIEGVIPFYKLIREGVVDPRSLSARPEQTLELIRRDPAFLMTLDKQGGLYSDAGVDTSNHPAEIASYPPSDPDRSAREVRKSIRNHTDKNVGVIIADTELFFLGTVDMPRGISGVPLRSKRFGEEDRFGRPKYGGVDAIAVELTAAASLLFGQTNEGVPVVVVRGYEYEMTDQPKDKSADFPSARRIAKEILRASIRFRISEYLDKLWYPFGKD